MKKIENYLVEKCEKYPILIYIMLIGVVLFTSWVESL